MRNRDGEEIELTSMDAIVFGMLIGIGVDILKPILREKLEEWKDRREHLRTKEGQKEKVDALEPVIQARAYAAKKSFDALVAAGFTEEQAFQLMNGSK